MESKNNWKGWLYLAPVIILLSVFTFFPIINTFFVSFLKDYNYMTGKFTGFTLDNYMSVLTPFGSLGGGPGSMFELVMKTALPNTLLLTVITVPCSIILSLIIAIALNSIKPWKKFFQTVFFMPYVTNAIAIGMVFSVIFSSDYGIINSMLRTPNLTWITPSPMTGEAVAYPRALFAICFYIVWHSLPYKILIFLGGLQNIDKQYYEAAQIDSTGKLKTAWKITIPLLSPQILYMMITSFIGAFKEYNSVIGLFGAGGGSFDINTGPTNMQTMVFFIYDQVAKNKVQYASAASIFLFIIIMIFTVIQNQVSKKRVHY